MRLRDYTAGLGWKIFPCYGINDDGVCMCCRGSKCEHPGKHPITAHGVKDATDDEQQIVAWLQSNERANWALACGSVSDVLVIDIDTHDANGFASLEMWEEKNGIKLPMTLTATTGSGGRHMYFRLNGRRVANRVGWLDGVDVRSDGGYVIIPPARHASGGVYSWDNWGTEIASAPDELVNAIGDRSSSKTAKDLDIDLSNLKDLLENGIPEGKRDDGLFRLACSLRRKGLDKMGADGVVILTYIIRAVGSASGFPPEESLAKVQSALAQDHTDGTTPSNTGNVAADLHLTDVGNRDRLLDIFNDDIVYSPERGWYRWLGDLHGWEHCEEDVIRNMAEKVPQQIREDIATVDDPKQAAAVAQFAARSESRASLTSLVDLCRGHEDVLRKPADFDRCLTDLWCANGVVDLRTGVLRPYRRDDLITKRTQTIYDPMADCSWWRRLIHEAVGEDGDMERYLQLAAGYTATGLISQQCFFTLSGPPASGKSTFIEGIQCALGDLATTTQREVLMSGRAGDAPKEELARLDGFRMVSVSETRAGDRFNESLMKQITGGDAVQARQLYKVGYAYTPKFKLWIGSNHDAFSDDPAMMRRIKMIHFSHTIPEKRRDPNLRDRIKSPEGRQAILNWIVEGAMMFLEKGRLDDTLSIRMAAETWRKASDTIGMWIDENMASSAEATCSVFDLFTNYSSWCKSSRVHAVSRLAFPKELRDRGYMVDGDSVRGLTPKDAERDMLGALGL